MNAVTFRPETLSVRQIGKSYVLYDGSQIVMSFGDRMTEAQQALQAIQQHKFDRLTTFGRGDQSMMMFVRHELTPHAACGLAFAAPGM